MVECASWENKHIYYSNNPLMNCGLKLFLQVFYLKMVLISGPVFWLKRIVKTKTKLKYRLLLDLCVSTKLG